MRRHVPPGVAYCPPLPDKAKHGDHHCAFTGRCFTWDASSKRWVLEERS